MQLSKNFKRSEFACPCGCGYDTVDAELLRVLQWLRDQTMLPVHVELGSICDAYNSEIGGNPMSKHIIAKAARITVDGLRPKIVARWLTENLDPSRYGIGLYPWGVYLDVRDDAARWIGEDEDKPIERPKI